MEPNAPAILAFVLMVLGVTAPPSTLVSGLIWALFICVVLLGITKTKGVWTYILILALTVAVAVFISIIYMGVPALAAMGLTGSMAMAGFTPLGIRIIIGASKMDFTKLAAAIITKVLGR